MALFQGRSYRRYHRYHGITADLLFKFFLRGSAFSMVSVIPTRYHITRSVSRITVGIIGHLNVDMEVRLEVPVREAGNVL